LNILWRRNWFDQHLSRKNRQPAWTSRRRSRERENRTQRSF